MKELAFIVSFVYIQFWHEALLARKAPLNDMLLLDSLVTLPEFPESGNPDK